MAGDAICVEPNAEHLTMELLALVFMTFRGDPTLLRLVGLAGEDLLWPSRAVLC